MGVVAGVSLCGAIGLAIGAAVAGFAGAPALCLGLIGSAMLATGVAIACAAIDLIHGR